MLSAFVVLASMTLAGQPADGKKVTLVRTPDGGIQPQAVMQDGVLHLIYYKGDARHGDVYYVKSADQGKSFTKPLRVNSTPRSVVAAGNVRGAHLGIGANGRAHVAWMGSMKVTPKGDHHLAPMLYARLNDEGSAFEPERNLIEQAWGLDGGGSISATGDKVCVAWHAPAPGTKGEEHRRIWVRTSLDAGKSFSTETAASPADAGACGCCGMRVLAGHAGETLVLFRGARDVNNRDMHLLVQAPGGGKFSAALLAPWEISTCPMSTMAFACGPKGTYLAWETEGQISFAHLATGAERPAPPTAAPGKSGKRRFPALAANGKEVLLAWTEGMAWNKGGSVAWQVFDAANQPTLNGKRGDYGRAEGVPTWSVVSAVALDDGRFLIFY